MTRVVCVYAAGHERATTLARFEDASRQFRSVVRRRDVKFNGFFLSSSSSFFFFLLFDSLTPSDLVLTFFLSLFFFFFFV